MKPEDLDADMDCVVCDGTGEEPGEARSWGGDCPRCQGTGSANPFRDGDANDEVIIHERYEDHGRFSSFAVQRMDRELFEARFGSLEMAIDDTEAEENGVDPDLRDQLRNDGLGSSLSGSDRYELPNGQTVGPDVFPDGEWPSSAELSLPEAASWADARGETQVADLLRRVRDARGSD